MQGCVETWVLWVCSGFRLQGAFHHKACAYVHPFDVACLCVHGTRCLALCGHASRGSGVYGGAPSVGLAPRGHPCLRRRRRRRQGCLLGGKGSALGNPLTDTTYYKIWRRCFLAWAMPSPIVIVISGRSPVFFTFRARVFVCRIHRSCRIRSRPCSLTRTWANTSRSPSPPSRCTSPPLRTARRTERSQGRGSGRSPFRWTPPRTPSSRCDDCLTRVAHTHASTHTLKHDARRVSLRKNAARGRCANKFDESFAAGSQTQNAPAPVYFSLPPSSRPPLFSLSLSSMPCPVSHRFSCVFPCVV